MLSRMGETLQSRFLPKANGLNLIRLGLAVSVILWHSFAITGRDVDSQFLVQLMGSTGVDGFFAISGYLIYSSWDRNPKVGAFLWARVLRIYPAFLVCLIVTPFVLAPIGLLLQGTDPTILFAGGEAFKYVGFNLFLWPLGSTLPGTPSDVPLPDVWNGSLWTLSWEFLCYLALLGLGISKAIRIRWMPIALFIAVTIATIAVTLTRIDVWVLTNGLRFSLMFLAGMVLYRYRNSLPVSPLLIGGAIVVTLLAMLLPNYRIVAAIPLAYALIASATYVRSRRLQFRTDISYGMYIYAFPIQQVLALAGLFVLPVPIFWLVSTALTAVFALGSWLLIERNALKLKRRASPVSTPLPVRT